MFDGSPLLLVRVDGEVKALKPDACEPLKKNKIQKNENVENR